MDLRKRLESDLYQSMRDNDAVAKNTIRMVLTSLKLAEVEKGHAFDESEIMGIIQKELKMRSESMNEFDKGNRQDLVEKTRKEMAVLEKYLPKQLTDEELLVIIDKVIKDTGASLSSDMGKVMKLVLPILQGKAPADRVSKLVKSRLTKE